MRQKRLKKMAYMYLVERTLIDRAAAIQCTSVLEQQQTAELGLRPRTIVLPNGMSVEPFKRLPERGRLRSRLGLSATDFLSVFVGRLHPMKRVDLTIGAFARVAAICPQAYLAIVGSDNGEETRLKDLVAALGLRSRIFFLGLLTGNDLLQLYSDADLLALLSSRENFGMVVLEAMASGLPVLVGTEVGLAQDVQAAGAGCVVGDEPDEIAQEWAALILDQARQSRCGEQGRLLVARSFSTEAVATRMLAVLEQVVAQSRCGFFAGSTQTG
jgi:glycosyltransferase involved in cell wall biosynthesis